MQLETSLDSVKTSSSFLKRFQRFNLVPNGKKGEEGGIFNLESDSSFSREKHILDEIPRLRSYVIFFANIVLRFRFKWRPPRQMEQVFRSFRVERSLFQYNRINDRAWLKVFRWIQFAAQTVYASYLWCVTTDLIRQSLLGRATGDRFKLPLQSYSDFAQPLLVVVKITLHLFSSLFLATDQLLAVCIASKYESI